MGECINLRRGGLRRALPVLDKSYPKAATVMRSGGEVTLEVKITTPGVPDKYTYQWYKDGAAISGATNSTYKFSTNIAAGQYSVYCNVTNAAGTVKSRTAVVQIDEPYLYYLGNPGGAYTAGWQITKAQPNGTAYTIGTLTMGDTSMVMNLSANNDGFVAPAKKTDLTYYSKIRAQVEFYHQQTSSNWRLAVVSANAPAKNYIVAETVVAAPAAANTVETKTIELNVSNLKDSYYVGIMGWSSGYETRATIKSVTLIP